MFFILSKIFWVLIQPLNVLCVLATAGLALRLKWARLGQKVMNFSVILILLFGIIPLGHFLTAWLEQQHPKPAFLPKAIDGIIVLGGPFEPAMSVKTGGLVVNDQIERFLCFVELGEKYPDAKLVSSGGNGDILNPNVKESNDAKAFLRLTKLHDRKILYEDKSRNTFENALYSKEMVNPKSGENWIVITSGFHMPRAVGVFNALGWAIIPYPCDYKTSGNYNLFGQLPNLTSNFSLLNLSIKEIIGMIVYSVTGKSALILKSSNVASQS